MILVFILFTGDFTMEFRGLDSLKVRFLMLKVRFLMLKYALKVRFLMLKFNKSE